MEKTPFAGLTVLEANESIYADNSAFISRDRIEIDRALRIGVKLHRHDGLAGLSNPVAVPSGAIIGSGGTIPAGISLTLGYTLEDTMGGETEISPTVLLTTPSPFDLPASAPVAILDTSTGTLDADAFTYAVTWSDGEGGETPIGPSTTIDRPPGYANAQIKLSGLDDGMEEAGAAEWRLYRARAGGEFVFLASGTGDTFNDDGATEAQCDVHPPTSNVNETGGVNQLKFCIPGSAALGAGSAATWINLYASQSGDFAESCLLLQVPIGSAGACPIFSSLELLDWQPPDVNRSYGGANRIDPDTELIDNHWKRPVAAFADLPEDAEDGEVRMVLDENVAYQFTEAKEWTPLMGAGSLPTRVTGSAITGSLAAGASENLVLALPGAAAQLLRMKTDAKARVRVYGDEAARTADEGREIGVDPEGDHGVQLDYANNFEAGGGDRRLTPIVNAANLDSPTKDRLYLRITNLEESAKKITVTFTLIQTEA